MNLPPFQANRSKTEWQQEQFLCLSRFRNRSFSGWNVALLAKTSHVVERIRYPIRPFADMELTALGRIYKKRQVSRAIDLSKHLEVWNSSNVFNSIVLVKISLLMLFMEVLDVYSRIAQNV